MTDTCIIYDDATERLANALDVAHKISFDNATDDEGLHGFIENHINQSDFTYTKLIIPCNLGSQSSPLDFMGINLGLHIRLTKELEEQRLISLIFVDNRSVEEILTSQVEKTGYLLTTKGCKLVKPNGSLIKNAIENAQFPLANELKSIINHLVLLSPEDTLSRHSIANQWGAMKLNEVSKVNALGADSDVLKKKKLLYYKWLLTKNETDFNNPNINLPNLLINNIGKQVLLIDDEANKGWSEVLEKIFSKKVFSYVPTNENQGLFLAEARNMIKSKDWDLILLDLRLTKEDNSSKTLVDSFQGTTLLKEIKSLNNGIQVIIFTASNKAWNMQKLMFKYEADGYYIKEAPDFNLGKQFTKENYESFKEQINTAFERGYLRWFYRNHQVLKPLILNLITKLPQDKENDFLYNEIIKQLDLAYDILKTNRANEDRFFEYAYLNYYQILENIVKIFHKYDENTKKHFLNIDTRKKIITYFKGQKRYSNIKFIKRKKKIFTAKHTSNMIRPYYKPTTLFKICALLLLKHNANDQEVRNFILLNQLRNEVVAHAKKDNRTININHLKEMYKLIYRLLTNKIHA